MDVFFLCMSPLINENENKKDFNIGGVKERRASFLDINLPPLSFLMIIDKGTNHQIWLCSIMVSTSVFQTDDTGSIPVTDLQKICNFQNFLL